MKTEKGILFIITLLCCMGIQGQKYYPLVAEGNQWNELYLYGMPPNETYKTEIKKITGDSLVDGRTYKKLMYVRDADAKNWKLWGLMRENIDEKKIYFKRGEAPEYLFFDFSLNAGESMITEVPSSLTYYSKVCIHIESIDYILINGEQRKMFTIKTTDDGGHFSSYIWIEGIGSTKGLFEGLIPEKPGVMISLLCFYQNEEFVYKPADSEYNDCFYWTTSINEITANDKFSIVNHDNKLKIVSNDGTLFALEMYTINGICIKKTANLSNFFEIKLEAFSDELYLIRIIQDENAFTIKFKK